MAVKNLKQSVTFRAKPHDVYEALVDARKHAEFSGMSAELEPKVGGRFRHYGGDLQGLVVELQPDRRIVLAWRASGWPKGSYSIAQFVLKKVRGGTRLNFDQFGIPTSDFRGIKTGWPEYYWRPMKQFLEK